MYNTIVENNDWKDWRKELSDVDRLRAVAPHAAARVWRDKFEEAKTALGNCLYQQDAQDIVNGAALPVPEGAPAFNPELGSIFDRRLERIISGQNFAIAPYDVRFQDAGTTGFIVDQDFLKKQLKGTEGADDIAEGEAAKRRTMQKDPFYAGVGAVINPYSLIKLYGSKGGQDLVDRKDQRRWYEVNEPPSGRLNYSLNPTTTDIINWGEGDPYGRTPYHYSDFVFCKFWNIVPNNRMITLRRYPAPIVDNLKFPGMDGFHSQGTASTKTSDNQEGTTNLAQTVTEDSNNGDNGTPPGGDGGKVDFPPMASAVTYFGEETNNSLAEILSFTTGVNWEDQDNAEVFNVTTTSNPDMDAGPGGGKLFGGLGKMAKMLNIATGNFDQNAMLNQGMLPPDPYKDGPYENRIIGPVNAITSVKKRARGIKYQSDINLTFEYVARPIGGVNTKAVLLDIISNFLIIGSATAMFWGGQHRFMGQPQTYPFMGGDKGIQEWYRGNPVGWGETAIDSFATKIVGGDGNDGLLAGLGNLFSGLLGGGKGGGGLNLKDIITGDNAAGNVVKAAAASRSNGAIPYLSGLKALLIGEPVGEWHITIGNPLNPIAMIGNLICDSLDVEFGEELGPDDFPLEVKVTAKLQHGMARDRDAIQSMFNRGMGRIYDLPDGFTSSAEYETAVDNFTGNADTKAGRSPSDWRLGTVIGGAATSGGTTGASATRNNSLQGGTSVWNTTSFATSSPNQTGGTFFSNTDTQSRSEFRAATWVSLKATS